MKSTAFINKQTIWIALLAAGMLSCNTGNENPDALSDETPDSLTFEEKNDWPKNQPELDNAQVEKNYYTYIIEPGTAPVPVVEREEPEKPMKNKVANRETDVPEKLDKPEVELEVKPDEIPTVDVNLYAVLTDLEMNRPPIYDKACLNEKYPVQCSNNKLTEYIKENLEYPRKAKFNDHDGLEYVKFTITADGEVRNINVISKDDPCSGCEGAAKKVVASMPNKWLPAIRNGEPVNVTVTLPVRFDTRQFGDRLF